MVVVCSKCGAVPAPEARACDICGMAVAAPPVVACTPVVMPIRAPRRGGALKTALLAASILAVLGATGFVLWQQGENALPAFAGSSVPATVPEPGSQAGGDLGAPLYPGAMVTGEPMHVRVPDGAVITAVFVTPAARQAVVDFYREILGAAVVEGNGRTILTAQTSEAESILITVSSHDASHDGQTKIVLVHTRRF